MLWARCGLVEVDRCHAKGIGHSITGSMLPPLRNPARSEVVDNDIYLGNLATLHVTI